MVQLRFAHLYLVVAVIAACCYSGEVRELIFFLGFSCKLFCFVAPLDGPKRTSTLLGLLTPAQLHHYNWQLQPGEI